jgi:hypothetical protein
MVDAWGGWSLLQEMLRTLKRISTKHGVSIPAVAVKYVLNQVNSSFQVKLVVDVYLAEESIHFDDFLRVPYVWKW